MAAKSRPTQLKRQRERALQEKRNRKAARRQEAKERKPNTPRLPGEEDPDIAGIRPGPQPPPYEIDDLEAEDTES